MKHKADGTPLVVIAGKEYGTGSSRDWAAKGTNLLGVRAVIVESFERIHRSNLVGMGVLPLQFKDGDTRAALGLTGDDSFTIRGVAEPQAAPGRRGRSDPPGRRDASPSPRCAASIPPTSWSISQRRHPALRAAQAGRLSRPLTGDKKGRLPRGGRPPRQGAIAARASPPCELLRLRRRPRHRRRGGAEQDHHRRLGHVRCRCSLVLELVEPEVEDDVELAGARDWSRAARRDVARGRGAGDDVARGRCAGRHVARGRRAGRDVARAGRGRRCRESTVEVEVE